MLNEAKQTKKPFSLLLSFLSSLLGLGLGFLILFSSFFFVCVFVSVHRRAQETKASWVSQTSLLRDFFVLFLDAIFFFFYIFNTVSFVFVHVGLLQILELRPKIALRFTWVWVLISVLSIIYLFIFNIKIFVGLCWFKFFVFVFLVYCYVLLACISS